MAAEDPSLPDNEFSVILPVIQEELSISIINEETDSLKLTKTVAQEVVPYGVQLKKERFEIKHLPFNKLIEEQVPAIRQEGDTTIISVTKEVLVIEKRLMLIEEIHVVRISENSVETGIETVRVEKVLVSRSSDKS